MSNINYVLGRGEELRKDIPKLFLSTKYVTEFINKWGISLYNIISVNFCSPVIEAGFDKDKTEAAIAREQAASVMAPKIDLFCAAFIDPLDCPDAPLDEDSSNYNPNP